MSGTGEQALTRSYGQWMKLALGVVLASVLLLLLDVVAQFAYFTATVTPVWLSVLSATAIFGLLAGFGGLFLMLGIAGAKAYRQEKRQGL